VIVVSPDLIVRAHAGLSADVGRAYHGARKSKPLRLVSRGNQTDKVTIETV
jgi:hypothetical protein